MGFLRKMYHPELFQGNLKRRNYFEGWYFKLTGRDTASAAAVIPGVALGCGPAWPESHAFVQFIRGGEARYFRYPLSAFQTDGTVFRIRVGENIFSREGISLRLEDGHSRIGGKLVFSDVLPFPKTPLRPGIMGPYGFVPGMECYHGVVSIRHGITGRLSIEGQEASFDGGTGYIEKDWGRGFPSAWVWLQANRFAGGEAFLFSVADIPWRGNSFVGFFCLLHAAGRTHLFATYTGAVLGELCESDGETRATVSHRDLTLQLSARPGPCGMLKAPKNGRMDCMIEETVSATVRVRLTQGGRVLFEGESDGAGMERHGQEGLMERIARLSTFH